MELNFVNSYSAEEVLLDFARYKQLPYSHAKASEIVLMDRF